MKEHQGGRVRLSEADIITFTVHIVRESPVLQRIRRAPGDQGRLPRPDRRRRAPLLGPVGLQEDQQAAGIPWHQDNGYTFIEPQQYLTLWIPLVDVDDENGCPWIAPGLHKLGTLQHWLTSIGKKCLDDAPDAVCVPAKAATSSCSPRSLRTAPGRTCARTRCARPTSCSTRRTAPMRSPRTAAGSRRRIRSGSSRSSTADG